MVKGYLVLENGTIFSGKMLGEAAPVNGEAVFNTSMNGYQEIITDPSYAGQILTFTYPSIGNYGSGYYGFESTRPALRGVVIKEIAGTPDHYESKWKLEEFISAYEIPCLTGVDTRALTRILRMYGTMGAVLTTNPGDRDDMIKLASQGRECLNANLVETVTCTGPWVAGKGKTRVVLMDFGVKQNIINSLAARDCQVVIVPAHTTAEQIMAVQPHGVVLSNGPGDPEACQYAVAEIKKLLGQVPIFGICLGHQLLGMALGARTYKLKFGHRGGNHTVQDVRTGRCFISSQNHGYAVDPDSLHPEEAAVSFINLNDGTVEGLVHKQYPAMSVQFHPEATPGPHDTAFLFDDFLQIASPRA